MLAPERSTVRAARRILVRISGLDRVATNAAGKTNMGLARMHAPCYIHHVRNTTHHIQRKTNMTHTHTEYCNACDSEVTYNVNASREPWGWEVEVEFVEAGCTHEAWDDDAHVARARENVITG